MSKESSSLHRMLGILDLFTEVSAPVDQEQVSSYLKCSRATAYRYLKVLSDAGLLAPVSGGRYVLGSRIIEFDRIIRLKDPLLNAAQPVMQAVSARLHTNAMICSYYGDKVMCIDRAWPDDSVESSYERGRPMPMFSGATAKSILANLSPYQLRSLMLWHASEIREAGLGENWDEFRAAMRALKKAGVCVSYGEVDSSRIGIGAPIFGPDEKVVGSFVFIVSARNADAQRVEQLSQEAQNAAAEITQQLQGV